MKHISKHASFIQFKRLLSAAIFASSAASLSTTTLTGITLFAAMLPATSVSAQEQTYFRYRNDHDIMVMSDSIPVEYARKGYEIVNRYGRVVKAIPPEPTAEEREQFLVEQQQQREIEEEQTRINTLDRELRLRYSNLNDILAAKKRKIQDVDNDLFTLSATIKNMDERIQSYQADAAEAERSGRNVNDDILSAIEQLQKDKLNINQSISQKAADKQAIEYSFNKDIKRFKIIEGIN